MVLFHWDPWGRSERNKERHAGADALISRFVVQMHWAFQTQGHLFLVLDYCSGRPCWMLDSLVLGADPSSSYNTLQKELSLERWRKLNLSSNESLILEGCQLLCSQKCCLREMGLSIRTFERKCRATIGGGLLRTCTQFHGVFWLEKPVSTKLPPLRQGYQWSSFQAKTQHQQGFGFAFPLSNKCK